jgi:hypothetical protein
MEAVRLHRVVEKDGELLITNLPCKKGQHVEVIVLTETPEMIKPARLTAKRLLESGLVGLWQDRQDILDSVAYARHLREEAQQRQR